MLFNSYIFLLVYLPVTVILFFFLGKIHARAAIGFLGLASVAFYAWWDVAWVPLLIGSILFNFFVGRWLASKRSDRSLLWSRSVFAAGVSGNLILLGYYKYANFIAVDVLAIFDLQATLGTIILPLGISFFTFTQIAFLADAYRGKAQEYDFPRYLLFVSYFPHLIAGPILHHSEMMPQFADKRNSTFNLENFSAGTVFFTIGIFKKVVIADQIAPFANPIFGGVGEVNLTAQEAWLGALAYSCQIYFDFSGYSDMAVGLARMMNVRLPYNFASPYKAANIIEFWRRWHMTLSRFLRDYLYIPLGGNRRGSTRRHVNLLLTMLLGGLWHGAGWTFVVWGGLHGIYLVVNHFWSTHLPSIGKWFGGGLTFFCVVVAWVFFRAEDLTSAFEMLRSMFGLNGLSLPEGFAAGPLGKLPLEGWLRFEGMFHNGLVDPVRAISTIGVALLIAWLLPNSQEFVDGMERRLRKSHRALRWRPSFAWGIIMGVCFGVSVSLLSGETPFLYFQF